MAIDLIWDAVGQKRKLWEQTMLLAVPALSPQFRKHSGEKTPLEKAVTFLRMPSQTPIIPGKGHSAQHEEKGGGSIPPAHSQFCLLTPLLTSQTRPYFQHEKTSFWLHTK
jgi:hypothetical protein